MDNNSAKEKYLKYKNKYLQLKQMRDKLGLEDARGGFGWSDITRTVSGAVGAVSGYITDAVTCNTYYNKDSDGKFKHCYNFESRDKMKEFLIQDIMGDIENISLDRTKQNNIPVKKVYTNTLLHELYKADFDILKMPKLAQLFMK